MRYLSVCSGIEAATVAWHPLGWQPWAFAEVDAFPSAVLAHHYPTVPNLGDMSRFEEWPDADVDVLVGGTPCQSFSVAGLRKGLDDPRGNLMLVYGAIARRYRPKWLVWENVPGVLSSNGGRDFGSFLWLLGELGYGFAYRVLDAQYFGLAQRRKRVFVVGCLGDWRRAAAVLLERASLRGDPAPRRQTRESVADTIAGGARSRGGYSEDDVPHVVGSLCADTHPGAYTGQDAYTGRLIAHTLRASGFDASEDGTGRGTPLVPVVSSTLQAGGNSTGGDRPPGTTVDTCDSLIPVHAFDARQSYVIQYGDKTGPLDTDGHTMAVAINLRGREGGAMPELSDLASLRAASGGSSRSLVASIHENPLQALTREDEANTRELHDICSALPGVAFMDPPDGGSVTIAEQVRRMYAALLARDAEVRALRQFANATWREFRAAARMCGLLDLAGNPTPLLTGEPGPGGEHE